MIVTLFIVGFFLPIILYCVTLALKVTLKTYMLAMGDEAGEASHSLYRSLNRGKNSTLGGAIRGVGKNAKKVVKGAKTAVKGAKTAVKVARTTIKVAKNAIRLMIKLIKALIVLIKAVIVLIIEGGWIVLLIVAVIWLCIMIGSWVAGICASLTGDGGLELPKTKVSGTVSNSVSEESSVDTTKITGTSGEKIAKLALQYGQVKGNKRFKYSMQHNVSKDPKLIDCCYFVCGVIQEATGYNYTGKKAKKTSIFNEKNSVDYGYTEALKDAMDKNGWKVYEGTVTSDVLDKKAKPGDILYRYGHVAIYYGKYKGKHIKVNASTGNPESFGCYDSLDNAVKQSGTKYGFGIAMTGEEGGSYYFTAIYRFGK